MEVDMESTKYIISYTDGTFCGLSIKEEKIDETDPNRIALPLYSRPPEEIENLDTSKCRVQGNNNGKHYTIIDIDRYPKNPCLFVKESAKQI